MLAYGNMIRYDPTLVNLISNFFVIQEVFHVYLNTFKNAATHLFLVIFGIH